MPELPEIENLARIVRPKVAGARVTNVRARVAKSANLPLQELRERARQVVVGVDRRAKHVVFRLPEGSVWLHLGLTAEPLIVHGNSNLEDFALGLSFDNSIALAIKTAFMGRLDYWTPEESTKKWNEFGPEPLDPSLTLDRFREIIEVGARQGVKALLMDQSVLAGIGNVYSDEVLAAACIHPARKAGSLEASEVERLYKAMRSVLQEAVDMGGEIEWPGLGPALGRYQMRVHGRDYDARTGSPVATIKLGSRTAYYVPDCQQLR